MRGSAVIALAALIAAAGGARAAGADAAAHYSKTYQACMDAAGGSTLPMRDCIAAESDAWDQVLNGRYRALMASLPADRQAALRGEERAWLKGRDETCAHAGDEEAGGSLQAVEIDLCVMDETIRRALALEGRR